MARDIQEIVESQLASWRAQRGALEGESVDGSPIALVISYAPFAGGESIADRVASRLQLPHHDQDIVEHIASSAHVHLETVESLDRHVQGRIDEYIASLFHEHNFDRGDYLRLLGRTVVALWEHGPCVISGHGAVHFVPRDHGLAVRLTAPAEVRAERLAQEREIELPHAQRELQRADSEQEAFHRRFFGVHVDNPDHYDLIIDTSRLEPDAAAALVSHAFQLRFRPPAGLVDTGNSAGGRWVPE
jgi:cytidylate kinase